MTTRMKLRRPFSILLAMLLIVVMVPIFPGMTQEANAKDRSSSSGANKIKADDLTVAQSALMEAASSSEDSVAPVLKEFKVVNTTVARPGVVQLQLNIVEEDSGFSDFDLSLSWDKSGVSQSGSISTGLEYGGAGGDMCSNFQLSLDQDGKQFGDYSGVYTFNLYIGKGANISDYTVDRLWIRDKYGNENAYEGEALSAIVLNGNNGFSVTGDASGDDFVAPVLNNCKILNTSVSRPGAVKIQLDVFEEGAGFSDFSISLAWDKGNMPQSGSISTGLEYGGAGGDMCSNFQLSLDQSSKQFGEGSGIYTFNLDVGEIANIASYTVTELWIRDRGGNETRYSADQLPVLFSNGSDSFSITGDSNADDSIAPVLNSYEILNPTVNRPGVMKLKIDITEEGSGLSDIDLSLSWMKNGIRRSGSISTGLEYGGAGGDMCSNFDFWNSNNMSNFGGKTGSYVFTLLIGEKADLSTYSIDRIWLRDKFGNTVAVGNTYSGDENDIVNYSSNGISAFVLKDEFDYSFATGINNPNLAKKLESMPLGSAAKVEIVGNKVLPKSCLDAIKGKDKTIVAYSSSVQWIIRGKQLTGETKDLNLGVSVLSVKGGESFADDDENKLALSDDSVKLEFYPNGVLPGKMQVRFKSDTLYDRGIAGNAPTLYYFDGKDLVLEDRDSDLNFDGTDKWCYVNITHNSTFAVSNTSALKLKKKQRTSIAHATISNLEQAIYTGKEIEQDPVVEFDDRKLEAGTDYTLSYKSNLNVGTATVTATGKGDYVGTAKATFRIAKAKNPAKINAKTKTVRTAKAKKKAQVVKAITVKRAKGKITYAKVKKGSSKKLTVNKKTGRITVKKGTQRGTYKIRVKVKVMGNKNYKSLAKTITVKVVLNRA